MVTEFQQKAKHVSTPNRDHTGSNKRTRYEMWSSKREKDKLKQNREENMEEKGECKNQRNQTKSIN